MIRELSGEALDPEVVDIFLDVVPDGPLPSSEELLPRNELVAAEKEATISSMTKPPQATLRA
jgi:hypothetical protein